MIYTLFFSENAWIYAHAPISPDATYLMFTATRGYEYEGDIAIDDVIIDTQPCYEEPTPAPTYEPTYEPTYGHTYAPGKMYSCMYVRFRFAIMTF